MMRSKWGLWENFVKTVPYEMKVGEFFAGILIFNFPNEKKEHFATKIGY